MPSPALRFLFYPSLLCLSLLLTPIYGEPSSLETYLELYRKYPLGPVGNHRQGEIELVLDPLEIARIEQIQMQKLQNQGYSLERARESSRVGILAEEGHWCLLRDAVIFPNGAKGTFSRIIPRSHLRSSGPTAQTASSHLAGVVMAPLLADGRVVLILNFRHSTRSWELELPRGWCQGEETFEQAAIRETIEETGYRLQSPQLLGYLQPDTTTSSTCCAVMAGFATEKKAGKQQESEAIDGIVALTKAQVKEGYVRGYIEITIQGHPQRLGLRDPYLPFALLIAEEKKLW